MRDFVCELVYFDASEKCFRTSTQDSGWTRNGELFCNDLLGIEFRVDIRVSGNKVDYMIPMSNIKENGDFKIKELIPITGAIRGREGDGGAIVLPVCIGMLCRTLEHPEEEHRIQVFAEDKYNPYWTNMPICGAFSAGSCSIFIGAGGQFDMDFRLRTSWGNEKEYLVDPIFMIRDYFDEDILNEDISFLTDRFAGDYRELAAYYRKYNLEVRKLPTLEDKVEQGNRDLDYSSRALTVRCRMAVKPLPATVFEQTPETEPKPHVYMKFADISEIAKEFAGQRVGPSEFCLVGWNHGGHDGAFPQILPPEESCGGEIELLKTIKNVTESGYPLSFHDNYYDGYTLAQNFNFDDVCCNHGPWKDPVKSNAGIVAGGRAYRVCAEKAAHKYAPANFAEVSRKFKIRGAYFSDVISIVGMHKCYHPLHPLDRRGNALCYKEILRLKQQYFKVSMSEGARDWALPELDRAFELANVSAPALPYADENIPLFPLVYHGFVIYNNCRSGINAWPGTKEYLENFAWGGMPMVYFHHLFHPEWTASGGWTEDLTFSTPEKLRDDVARIKRITDDLARLAPVRFSFMEDCICLNENVSETVYANGLSVIINTSGTPVLLPDGVEVPPCEFIVLNRKVDKK